METLQSAMSVPDHQTRPDGRETSFSLAYGTDVIISVDVYMPTLRTVEVGWDQIVAQLRLAQDQSEERRR